MKNVLRGFTLIELLIVVAIIAILAAIAVPNFLEAQVRSKISRAKADSRSIQVALESYHVDANKYPPSHWVQLSRRVHWLTTPIAYITSFPMDPFNPGVDEMSRPNGDPPSAPYLTIGTCEDNDPNAVNDPSNPYFVIEELRMYAEELTRPHESLMYVILSYGPGLNPSNTPNPNRFNQPYFDVAYDATNGTVSAGMITVVGP